MAVAEYLSRKWGKKTQTRITRVTVPTTPGTIVKSNPNRFMWHIYNLTADAGVIGFDSEISSVLGIAITQAGGNAGMSVDEDGGFVTQEVWGKTNGAAAATWYLIEEIAL